MPCFQQYTPVCWDDRGDRLYRRYYLSGIRGLGERSQVSLSQEQKLHQADKIGEYRANTHYGNRVSLGVARLQVFAAALLFSTGGAGIKAAAFTGLQVSALRSGIAAVVLILLLRGRLVLSPAMLGTGIVYAATLTLFVLSTKLTTAANAIFLQATAPLYLLLLGPLVLSERFRARDVVFLVGGRGGAGAVRHWPAARRRRRHPIRRPGTCWRLSAASPGRSRCSGCATCSEAPRRTQRRGMSAVAIGNLFASVAACAVCVAAARGQRERVGHDRLPRRVSDRGWRMFF